MEGLRNWNNEHDTLIAVVKEAQDRFEQQISQHILLAQRQRFLPKDLIEEEKMDNIARFHEHNACYNLGLFYHVF